MYILGIDCGGTSTEALLITTEGIVTGRGQGGPANYTSNGIQGVVKSALEAIRGCLRQNELNLATLQNRGVFLALGVSGAGREQEMTAIRQAFQNEGFVHVVVSHDATIALLGALGGADGVAVIAGTGSIAYGLSKARSSRVGGWGYLLGDEGSAFWIALRALQHVMMGYDGRITQDQVLFEAVSTYFDITNQAELVPLIYKTPLDRGFIGGFTKKIASLAAEGHLLSQGILNEAGRHLGTLAVAALARLDLLESSGRVGACGGVFSAGEWVLTPMKKEIQLVAPNQKLTLPDFKPVVGAVFLAARHFDLEIKRLVMGLKHSV